MLRVPGSEKDLFRVKSQGGDVRVVYSPLDALTIAKDNPDRQVVFFGIGFETTAPANAMTVFEAKRLGVENFSLLVSHVLVPPAIAAIMESPTCRVQAFLAAGHVCCVMGTREYPELCDKYGIPIVVTGFEPLDILEGIRRTVIQLESGRHELENAYPRAVRDEGNAPAKAMLNDVFEVTDRAWRRSSAPSRRAGGGCPPSTASSMPNTGSRSPTFTPRSLRCAGRARCFRA